MDTLVAWKKKTDRYRDESPDDNTEVRSPKLTDSFNEAGFIMRDEENAKAMKRMKIKW